MENIILNAVTEIKTLIESSIVEGGVDGKNNLIRSQRPICILQDLLNQSQTQGHFCHLFHRYLQTKLF